MSRVKQTARENERVAEKLQRPSLSQVLELVVLFLKLDATMQKLLKQVQNHLFF